MGKQQQDVYLGTYCTYTRTDTHADKLLVVMKAPGVHHSVLSSGY